MRKMPKQKPGKSKQDYKTPLELIYAVEKRFGPISIDLAASDGHVCDNYYSESYDSLSIEWMLQENTAWLNPPFSRIEPWAKKCFFESTRLKRKGCIILLTPASIGANWFHHWVYGRAAVIALNPRLTFVGETTPYPKDCMLSVYRKHPPLVRDRFTVWRNWNQRPPL